MVSATGDERVPIVFVDEFECMGQKSNLRQVVAHELPTRFEGDGLLGLDFLRQFVLNIDFVNGTIALHPPRSRWWPFPR